MNNHEVKAREAKRNQIKKEVGEYLASGGVIQKCTAYDNNHTNYLNGKAKGIDKRACLGVGEYGTN